MIKTSWFSLLRLNFFNFGDRSIHQFVLIEIKPLFSIVLFWFHKSDKVQDRFHTHAFNAVSFKLFGSYDEHVLESEDPVKVRIEERTSVIKYFPRDSYHAIGKSKNGCLTLLVSGPWKRTWKEWIDGETRVYRWTRDEVSDK
jgi:hypothetical protein